MPESRDDTSSSPFPLRDFLGEMFAQTVDLWFAKQAELLANVDALTHGWLHRRRQGVDATREAIAKLTECQDPAEILQIQQDWFSGVSRRTMEDIAALNDGISSMTKKATADFETVARQVSALNPDYASMVKRGTGGVEEDVRQYPSAIH